MRGFFYPVILRGENGAAGPKATNAPGSAMATARKIIGGFHITPSAPALPLGPVSWMKSIHNPTHTQHPFMKSVHQPTELNKTCKKTRVSGRSSAGQWPGAVVAITIGGENVSLAIVIATAGAADERWQLTAGLTRFSSLLSTSHVTETLFFLRFFFRPPKKMGNFLHEYFRFD